MKKQEQTLVIDNPEAARALQDVQFLGYFLEPTSPSSVAKKAGIAANLVHHHVRRCLELDLLFETKREAGKVFYQLTARVFKMPHNLLGFEDSTAVTLRNLTKAFSQAHEKSERLSSPEPESFAVMSFDPEFNPQKKSPSSSGIGSEETRPSHFQLVTITLRPSSYRELVQKIAMLLSEAKSETTRDAAQCTVGLMTFEGGLTEEVANEHNESRWMSTYLPDVSMMQ